MEQERPLGERFEMRMPKDLVERIDRWRARRMPLPSRAEAVRRLLDAALKPVRKSSLKAIGAAVGLLLGVMGNAAAQQAWGVPGQIGGPTLLPQERHQHWREDYDKAHPTPRIEALPCHGHAVDVKRFRESGFQIRELTAPEIANVVAWERQHSSPAHVEALERLQMGHTWYAAVQVGGFKTTLWLQAGMLAIADPADPYHCAILSQSLEASDLVAMIHGDW
ncbi:MAG TPA: ribbon-helix-helix domain-containing protein [Acetobacteraceae bacterium]|nr:ribbon-helix-helix domain-containing protein [Acetobacteraceae bacterium]